MVVDLCRQNIPLIIFSAGIGNVIDIFMRKKFGKMPENVHIISNMMVRVLLFILRSYSKDLLTVGNQT